MASVLAYYHERIDMVWQCCIDTDPLIAQYLFDAVTQDLSFPDLEGRGVPFGRDLFYDRLHKFFYILDKVRK